VSNFEQIVVSPYDNLVDVDDCLARPGSPREGGSGPAQEAAMDTTTLLIIIIVLILIGGGGWYGRGRWF
jgi:hypothetical protein